MLDSVIRDRKKRDNDTLNKYLFIAQSSLKKEQFHKAREYANLVLEINPENCDAWLIKMKLTALHGDSVDMSETIFYGQKAIELAAPNNKEDIKTIVYTFFLKEAYSILDYIHILASDVDEIKEHMGLESLRRNVCFAGGKTREFDEKVIRLILDSCEEIAKAKTVIPEEEIKTTKEYQVLTEIIVDKFNKILEVLYKRMKIYNAELNSESKVRIEKILKTLRAGSYREQERMIQEEIKKSKLQAEVKKIEERKKLREETERNKRIRNFMIVAATILVVISALVLLKGYSIAPGGKTGLNSYSIDNNQIGNLN